MKKTNLLKCGSLLAVAATLAATGCNKPTTEDYEKWAVENGWVAPVDLTSSATSQGKGLNMGAWEWSEDLKKATIKEFLKGDQIQDVNGNPVAYNYRSMYAIATAVNTGGEIKVTNTNVEFVLNPETFEFYGMGENGTEKIIEFGANQNVSLNWWRQLNATDEAYPTGFGSEADYYHSYGVQINGKVTVLTVDSPEADILRVFNHYCPTIAQHRAMWATFTTDAQKLAYAKQVLGFGKAYYVTPETIVVTAAYDSMSKSLYNKGYTEEQRDLAVKAAKCMTYSTDAGTYDFISDEFWTIKLNAKKAALAADAQNNYAALNAYYGNWDTRYVLTEAVEGTGAKGDVVNITNDEVPAALQGKVQKQINWARRFAMENTNTCGMMSQQTLKFTK